MLQKLMVKSKLHYKKANYLALQTTLHELYYYSNEINQQLVFKSKAVNKRAHDRGALTMRAVVICARSHKIVGFSWYL